MIADLVIGTGLRSGAVHKSLAASIPSALSLWLSCSWSFCQNVFVSIRTVGTIASHSIIDLAKGLVKQLEITASRMIARKVIF